MLCMCKTKGHFTEFTSLWCCSVTKLCSTLCDSVDCSMSGFPVFHYLPVCSDSCSLSQWCYLIISSSASVFFTFNLSQHFPVSLLLTSGGQSIGVSASVPVLRMNIQDWFPLGLIGLISLHSKGLFSSITIWKNQFSSVQSSLWSNSHPYMTTGKTIALTIQLPRWLSW